MQTAQELVGPCPVGLETLALGHQIFLHPYVVVVESEVCGILLMLQRDRPVSADKGARSVGSAARRQWRCRVEMGPRSVGGSLSGSCPRRFSWCPWLGFREVVSHLAESPIVAEPRAAPNRVRELSSTRVQGLEFLAFRFLVVSPRRRGCCRASALLLPADPGCSIPQGCLWPCLPRVRRTSARRYIPGLCAPWKLKRLMSSIYNFFDFQGAFCETSQVTRLTRNR